MRRNTEYTWSIAAIQVCIAFYVFGTFHHCILHGRNIPTALQYCVRFPGAHLQCQSYSKAEFRYTCAGVDQMQARLLYTLTIKNLQNYTVNIVILYPARQCDRHKVFSKRRRLHSGDALVAE